MKALSKFALLGLLITLPLKAQSNATVADLMYLTPVGSILTDTKLQMYKSSYTLEIGNNSKTEFDSSHTLLEETLRFGVVQDLELAATIGFVFGGSNEQTASGSAPVNSDYSGMSDIELAGKYRLLHGSNSFANLDLIATFSPAFGNKQKASSKDSGNAFRGGHAVGFGAEMGFELSNFSWKLGLIYDMYMTQTIEDSNGVETEEIDSHGDIRAYAALQFFIMGVHSFDLHAGLINRGAYDQTTIATKKSTKLDSGMDFHVGLGFNYSISKDFFISPNAMYYFGGDRDVSSEVISNSQRTDRSILEAGLSVKYQF